MHIVGLGSNVRFAVTDRYGGTSAGAFRSLNLSDHVEDEPARVADNRRRAADGLGLRPESVAWLNQVHGSDVAVIDEPPTDGPPRADAAVTGRPGVALAVLVADCVPVLLADRDAGVLAVAHAGRRGLVAGVVSATLAAMTSLGADPERTSALIGPAVGPCCYEVPADLQAEVVGKIPATAGRTRRDTPALDLPAGTHAELTRAGVHRVRRMEVCTAEDPAYFSHRRDGVTGRFAGYAWRQ